MELVFLTLRHPGGFGDFQKKQRLNARGFAWKFLLSGVLYRPVKVSKDAASLLVCTQKKSFGVRVFCLWRHKWRTFGQATLAHFAWPWVPTVRW